MSVQIQIPTPLRRFTGEAAEVSVEGATVGEAMKALVASHQQLEPHLFSPEGTLRTFVNIFLNDEDVRYLEREDTAVSDGDTLAIIPSIAGGNIR